MESQTISKLEANQNKYIITGYLTKWEITKMISEYCLNHPEITEGQKKFLLKIPMATWQRLEPVNLNKDKMVQNHELPKYDMYQYIKLFLDNPTLPGEMKRYKSKYERLHNLTRNYRFVVYKKENMKYSHGYVNHKNIAYGFGFKIDGSNLIYILAEFHDINSPDKTLTGSDHYYYNSLYRKNLEVIGEYEFYSSLASDHPEFDGERKSVIEILHAYQLRIKH